MPKFDVDAKVFLSALAAVSLAASEDTSNPRQNCVLLEWQYETLRLVATNGHWLACYEFAKADFGNFPGDTGDVTVDLNSVNSAIKSFGKKTTGRLVIDTDASTFSTPGLTVAYTATGATFPPWRKIMPEAGRKSKVGSIGVAAEYLIEAANCFRVANGRTKRDGNLPLLLEFGHDSDDPIRITVGPLGHVDLTVVVMPCRK